MEGSRLSQTSVYTVKQVLMSNSTIWKVFCYSGPNISIIKQNAYSSFVNVKGISLISLCGDWGKE
jgi:hypothetical protein